MLSRLCEMCALVTNRNENYLCTATFGCIFFKDNTTSWTQNMPLLYDGDFITEVKYYQYKIFIGVYSIVP